METAIRKVISLSVPEIKLTYDRKFKTLDLPIIRHHKEVYDFLIANWDFEQILIREEFKIIPLNHNCRALGIYSHTTGGLDGTACDVQLIMACVLKSLATGIILAHNHPSGNLSPSKADRYITERLVEICRLHEIKVLDHLIISDKSYYSFSQNGDI